MFKMINQSKTQDLRSWAKWEASGAVENADNAYLRFVLSQPSKRFIHIINNSRGFYEFQCREYGFGGIDSNYKAVYIQRHESVREVPFKNGRVLVSQVHEMTDGEPLSFVLVPGFIKAHGKTEQGLKVTKVVPIRNEK